MMRDGRIALELDPRTRSTITTRELLNIFHDQGVQSDRILLSADE